MKRFFILIGLFLILVLVLSFCRLFPGPPSMKRLEEKYVEHQADFEKIAAYFVDLSREVDFNDVWIYGIDESYWALHLYTGELPVEVYQCTEVAVIDAIQRMFSDVNCEVISYDKEYVWFQFWSTLDDGKGLAYSTKVQSLHYTTRVPSTYKMQPTKFDHWYVWESE